MTELESLIETARTELRLAKESCAMAIGAAAQLVAETRAASLRARLTDLECLRLYLRASV